MKQEALLSVSQSVCSGARERCVPGHKLSPNRSQITDCDPDVSAYQDRYNMHACPAELHPPGHCRIATPLPHNAIFPPTRSSRLGTSGTIIESPAAASICQQAESYLRAQYAVPGDHPTPVPARERCRRPVHVHHHQLRRPDARERVRQRR
jgi:hypothetical protein